MLRRLALAVTLALGLPGGLARADWSADAELCSKGAVGSAPAE
jgi:hypothetical protein